MMLFWTVCTVSLQFPLLARDMWWCGIRSNILLQTHCGPESQGRYVNFHCSRLNVGGFWSPSFGFSHFVLLAHSRVKNAGSKISKIVCDRGVKSQWWLWQSRYNSRLFVQFINPFANVNLVNLTAEKTGHFATTKYRILISSGYQTQCFPLPFHYHLTAGSEMHVCDSISHHPMTNSRMCELMSLKRTAPEVAPVIWKLMMFDLWLLTHTCNPSRLCISHSYCIVIWAVMRLGEAVHAYSLKMNHQFWIFANPFRTLLFFSRHSSNVFPFFCTYWHLDPKECAYV